MTTSGRGQLSFLFGGFGPAGDLFCLAEVVETEGCCWRLGGGRRWHLVVVGGLWSDF